ncbi:MAG TPA: hypothetical protein VGA30_03670, partial [Actinomycetota bacterium]
LALGHATAYTFASVTAAVIISRRVGGFDVRQLARALGQILLAGLATGAAALLVSRSIGTALGTASLGPQTLQVVAGVVAGAGAFLAVVAAFRMPELSMVRELVRSRWTRRSR